MNSHRLALVALLFVGCIRGESFRPRYEARQVFAEQTGCEEVEVAAVPLGPYRIDPLVDTRVRVVAWGCGQRAQLLCSRFSRFGSFGSCEDDPTYQAPVVAEPAVVKIYTRYAQLGAPQRQRVTIDGEELVFPNLPVAVAVPVTPGMRAFNFSSTDVERNVSHYTTTTRERHGNSLYDVTRQHTLITHTLGAGCGQDFSVQLEPNGVYRVELDYQSAGACSIRCSREVETSQGTVLTACYGAM